MKALYIAPILLFLPNLVQANDSTKMAQRMCDLGSQIVQDVHSTKAKRREILFTLLVAMDKSSELLSDIQKEAVKEAKLNYIELQESKERERLENNLIELSNQCLGVAPSSD